MKPVPVPDLRLAGLAAGGWAAALIVLAGPASYGFLLAALACSVALIGWRLHRRWSAGVALVLVGVATVGFAGALRVQARDDSPVSLLAHDRVIVAATLVVTDDPHPVLQVLAGAPTTYVLPSRLVTLDSGGRRVTQPVRLLVLGQGSGWARLLPSQQIRTHGRLMSPRGGDLTAAVLSAHGQPELLGRPCYVQRAAGRLRAGLRTASSGLPAGPRGLLPGLVVGDTSGMDPQLVTDFRTTGLTHLVAVSGTNCAIVAGSVLLVLRRCRAGPRVAAVGAGLALVGFVVLVRPSPSVLRAAVMGAIGLLALASGRTRAALPALAATVTGLLLYDPALARSAGFALSALATLGLLLVAPTWRDHLRRRLPAGLAEALAVPAAAQVACAPVIAALSAQVSLVSVPANLLAVPAVAAATLVGVLAALVSPVSPPAAAVLARVAGLPTAWLVLVAQHGAAVPNGVLPWPGGRWGGLLLAGALVTGALLLRRRALRRGALAACLAVVVTTTGMHSIPGAWPPPGWFLVACDVGQGDGLAISTGPGSALVVDTGPEPAEMDACLRALHVRTVPLLALTHLHADHVGGLAGVLAGRQVGTVLVDDFHEPTAAWQTVQRLAAARHIPLRQVTPGERFTIGPTTLSILGPLQVIRGSRSDPNNNSIVARVAQRGRSVLLTGDADSEEEQTLLQAGTDLRADVLKEPHHGSSYFDPTFIAATHARASVISVGADNDYGHPAPATLQLLQRDGIAVLRTDQSGDVALSIVDGALQWSSAHTHQPPRAVGGSTSGALGRPYGPAPLAGTGLSAPRATMTSCWPLSCSSSETNSCSSTAPSTSGCRARGPPTPMSRFTGWRPPA